MDFTQLIWMKYCWGHNSCCKSMVKFLLSDLNTVFVWGHFRDALMVLDGVNPWKKLDLPVE